MPSTLDVRRSTAQRPEASLVEDARRGDDHAFGELYARYRPRIYAFILSRVHDHGRAEDIAQEVFMSALRQLRATDQEIALQPWLYTIAKNACVDEFRRGARAGAVPVGSDDDLAVGRGPMLSLVPTPDDAAESRQRLNDLRGAFGGLSDTHRRLLVMREFEGLSYDEIGDRLGMRRQMVESQLFRARRKLGSEYDELASGRRCGQIVDAIATGTLETIKGIGVKQRRLVQRHLSHCESCRRHALMANVDTSLLKPQSIADKLAALLPFGLIRKLWPHGGGGASSAAGGAKAAAGAAGGAVGGSAAAGSTVSLGTAAVAAAVVAVAGAGGGLALSQHHHASPTRSTPAHVARPATDRDPNPAGAAPRTHQLRTGATHHLADAGRGDARRGRLHGRHGPRDTGHNNAKLSGSRTSGGGSGSHRTGGGSGHGGAGGNKRTGGGGSSGGGSSGGGSSSGGGASSSGGDNTSVGTGGSSKQSGGTVGGTVSQTGNTVGGVVQQTGGTVGGTVSQTGNTVGGVVQQTGGAVGGTVSQTGSTVGSVVQQTGSTVGGAVNTVAPGAGNVVTGVTNTAGGAVSQTGSAVGGAVTNVTGSVGSTVGQTGSAVGGALGGVTKVVGGVLGGK